MSVSAFPLPVSARITLALMVPCAIAALAGLGLTGFAGYRLLVWPSATATLHGSTPKLIYRGNQLAGTTSEQHYSFQRKDGSTGVFSFHSRDAEKEMSVLYSPSGGKEIKDVFTDGEWVRRSTVNWELLGGLVLLVGGLAGCLLGGVVVWGGYQSARRAARRAERLADGDATVLPG